eukprot:3366361-Pleurochrysis_carterae.AAC.2
MIEWIRRRELVDEKVSSHDLAMQTAVFSPLALSSPVALDCTFLCAHCLCQVRAAEWLQRLTNLKCRGHVIRKTTTCAAAYMLHQKSFGAFGANLIASELK